jgi:predicted PolB exonuclease-like 3'-5' exonuclease
MSSVIFDIETLGFPLDSFDEVQQEYLLKFADTEEKRESEIQKFALSAHTGRIIAVAMINPETMGGKVFYQSDTVDQFYSDDKKTEFISGDEKEILENFWRTIQHYDQFITFNGRGFDCPFLMLRSAMHMIRPTRNLVPYRYDPSIHCDLLDQLTFYGAIKKYNLDFYCKSFGIKSPKSEGVTGLDLGRLFEERRYKDIAQYCLGDVIATAELFKRWNNCLNIKS